MLKLEKQAAKEEGGIKARFYIDVEDKALEESEREMAKKF